MEDKKSLLMRIMTCDFILAETALFLDSHPNCADALAFYYGMLTHADYAGQANWQWTEGPWPWEYKEG